MGYCDDDSPLLEQAGGKSTDHFEPGSPNKLHHSAPPPPGRFPMRRSRLLVLACAAIVGVPLMLTAHTLTARNAAAAAAAALLPAWTYVYPTKVALPAHYDGQYTSNPLNRTLGFEKILVLNLPRRKDKKDEMLMLAHASAIDVDFLYTKTMAELKDTSFPYHKGYDHAGALGVWRAHADAWDAIVEQGYSSALILEDDSDWDVDFRYALQQMQQPLATLIKSVDSSIPYPHAVVSTPADPWMSQEWDVLNFGLCLEYPFKQADSSPLVHDIERPPYIMYEDLTMPYLDKDDSGDTENAYDLFRHYNESWPKSTDTQTPRKRMLTVSHRPVCTNAYAVTQRGAARLLLHTTRNLYAPVDLLMGDLTAAGKLRSFETVPHVMGQWKQWDNNEKASDNIILGMTPDEIARYTAAQEAIDANGEMNHDPYVGRTNNIPNSMRAAIPRMLEHSFVSLDG